MPFCSIVESRHGKFCEKWETCLLGEDAAPGVIGLVSDGTCVLYAMVLQMLPWTAIFLLVLDAVADALLVFHSRTFYSV